MSWKGDTFTGVLIGAAGIGLLCFLIAMAVDLSTHTYVTVSLVNARGLDAGEETGTNPVEFDVAIGFLRLGNLAVGHDGGQVTISHAGVKLAEGSVPKFYVAGGHKKRVEATTAVASAGKDQAPLPQVFRDHIWVDQQLHGEAEFDVTLSFTDVNITTGKTTQNYHYCKAGLALHGKPKPSNCGQPQSFL
nr:unnamed protein product [Digitaria exilis]